MRQVQMYARTEHRDRIHTLAREHGAPDPIVLGALERDGSWALFLVEVPNDRVGSFLDRVGALADDARFTLLPIGVLPIETPLTEVRQRVRDVSPLSTLELVLAGMQSIGSWKAMLLYSVLSGIIGAYGVIFNVTYLLVAAMLINPMGAPAIVAVIAVAVGDVRLFGRGALRFFVSLVVQAAAAALLGLSYGLEFSTEMMEQITNLSILAALLALVAGAAGAQSQVSADRDSLVSGTASGFMVAAALAPPAAVLGLAIPLGRWDYVALMGFLLALQFVAIALGGWLALLGFGVRPGDPSLHRGSPRARTALVAAVAMLLVGSVVWQQRMDPRFLKADHSREAVRVAREQVQAVTGSGVVEVGARFSRPELGRHRGEGLIVEVLVEKPSRELDDAELEAAIRRSIEEAIRARMQDVVPFVDVTVLPPAR